MTNTKIEKFIDDVKSELVKSYRAKTEDLDDLDIETNYDDENYNDIIEQECERLSSEEKRTDDEICERFIEVFRREGLLGEFTDYCDFSSDDWKEWRRAWDSEIYAEATKRALWEKKELANEKN